MLAASGNRQPPVNHGNKAGRAGIVSILQARRQRGPVFFRGEAIEIRHCHSDVTCGCRTLPRCRTFDFGRQTGLVLSPSISVPDLLAVSAIVVLVAVAGSLQPALKASRMEPVEALRHA